MEFDCLRPKPQYQFHDYYKTHLDDLIYCEFCDTYVFEYCIIHGPLLVIPDTVPACTASRLPRAALTLPGRFLHIAPSTMPGGRLGVFASLDIPSRVRFGPYGGVRTKEHTSAYAWQVVDSDLKPLYTIDASDPNRSNWMRYVNCPHRQFQQNLVAYQFRGQIYYRTIKTVRRNTELLVFFGSEAAHSIGVHLGYYCWPKQKAVPEPLESIQHSLEESAVQSDAKNDHRLNQLDAFKIHIHTPQAGEKNQINQKSNNLSHLKSHTRTHTGENPYKCDHCEYTANELNTLKRHIRTHTGEKPYKCDHCEYTANELGTIKCHIRTHTGEKPYKCDHCEYRTNHLHHLKSHTRTHTGEKRYKCDDCEYRANELSTLKSHIRTHTGEKPYKCDHCEYRANNLGNLKRHIRTHTGEKPYKCDHCEYRANQLPHLKDHIRTHTGEKPYKCDHCEYRAKQSNDLKRHIRTHTGEKLYKCDHCEYMANRLSILRSHIRTHTGEKPYKCDYCQYRANQLTNLKRHIRTHTGEKR